MSSQTNITGTSPKGLEFLILHEGEVLKTYRDAVGVLTIGVGLTKASGVIDPKPGQTITKKESRRLLAQALEQNYETAVAEVMGRPGTGCEPHEFDAGVSFHFNTGAIKRASWVTYWRRRDWPQVKSRLAQWRKGGGRVLPGLVRRRDEEYELLHKGIYTGVKNLPRTGTDLARIVIPMTDPQVKAAADSLAGLGFGSAEKGQLTDTAVRAFQRAHDLTVDGIYGRATASTLQRVLDLRAKGVTTAAAALAGLGETSTEAIPIDLPIGEGVTLIAAIRCLWLIYTYRDTVATLLQAQLPAVAKFLRSF